MLPQFQDRLPILVPKGNSHYYSIPGIDGLWPSVTTILKVIDKSTPLMIWSRREALAEAYNLIHTHWPDMAMDEIFALAEKYPDEARDTAADLGSRLHQAIDSAFEIGMEIIALGAAKMPEVEEEDRPAFTAALNFLARQNLIPVATEFASWNPDRPGAPSPGTVDVVARNADGELVVVDWKRSSGIYKEAAYQVAAYANNVAMLTGEDVVEAWVVQLPKPGSTVTNSKPITDLPGAYHTYLAAERLYYSLNLKVM